MTVFGSPTGVLYPLGLIVVATPGTPVGLGQNVPITTAFGTAANPVPMVANEISFKARGGTSGTGSNVANTGNIYIILGKNGNKSIQNSILLDIAPGNGFVLSSAAFNSPLTLSSIFIDADTGNDAVRVFVMIA
jgi:hypothetical protein